MNGAYITEKKTFKVPLIKVHPNAVLISKIMLTLKVGY